MTQWRLDWPVPGGTPECSGLLKSVPEDFQVIELLETGGPIHELGGGLPLTVPGQGEHLLVYLEKTGDNTAWVAKQLGELSGCGDSGVGFSGLKDRHAVTRQWFSVQRPGLESEDAAFVETLQQHWRILAVARRTHKLRRGDHHANEFRIRLRKVTGDVAAVEDGLTRLSSEGCPNYFGLQRFGHDGGNLDRAVAMAGRPAPRRRRGRKPGSGKDGLYFSAARSWLFNEVLAERVEQGTWQSLLIGEPGEEPTGPLWGDGGTVAQDDQADLEREVVARHPAMAAVFASTRMSPERRPLILMPQGLEWNLEGEGDEVVLNLKFTLTPGQFATVLLSSVLKISEQR